ncbi:MAG: hypothetical protein OEU68_12430 [Nitrospira sp.]|nr:hypothetical protein [Nitrospira sp.]MDH4357874.1 hypothetical protein [Nitrospira sp.]MDH5318275.1 hypothetical protein [Nitrospira sp.]
MAYESSEDFTLRTPVTEEVLDSMRGGFQRDPDGPFMSFGIERNVFDNGKLVSSTVLKIPDLARFADRDWNPLADHKGMKPFADRSGMKLSVEHSNVKPFANQTDVRPVADRPSDTFTLIQSGPGNSLPHDVSSLPPFTTIIQNSLDNRTIQSQTVINATVEALTWARSLQLGNALSQASIEAIRH